MQTKDFYKQVSPNVLKCTTCWLQQLGKSPQQHFTNTNQRQSSYKAVFLLGKVAVKNAKILKTSTMRQQNIYVESLILLEIALISQCALTQDTFLKFSVFYIQKAWESR